MLATQIWRWSHEKQEHVDQEIRPGLNMIHRKYHQSSLLSYPSEGKLTLHKHQHRKHNPKLQKNQLMARGSFTFNTLFVASPPCFQNPQTDKFTQSSSSHMCTSGWAKTWGEKLLLMTTPYKKTHLYFPFKVNTTTLAPTVLIVREKPFTLKPK